MLQQDLRAGQGRGLWAVGCGLWAVGSPGEAGMPRGAVLIAVGVLEQRLLGWSCKQADRGIQIKVIYHWD